MDLFDWEAQDLANARNPESYSIFESQSLASPRETITISLKCDVCDALLPSSTEHRRHIKTHGYTCSECLRSFLSHESLGYHAGQTGHNAYKCRTCDAKFSRRDVMLRHKLQHSAPSHKWSCGLCKKWRAPNGFARKDHLTQHRRNYHHIEDETLTLKVNYISTALSGFHAYCLSEGCSKFRSPVNHGEVLQLMNNPLFPTRGVYTAHMRFEHDQSLFPCTVTGCKRVNGKGFFRKRGLMKHMAAEHAIQPDDITQELTTQPEENAQEHVTQPEQIAQEQPAAPMQVNNNNNIQNFDNIIEDFAAENFAADNFIVENYFSTENFTPQFTQWN